MTRIKLKYINEFIDRHGKVRRYVRVPGRRKVPLKGAPGSAEFMEAYTAALADASPRLEIGAIHTRQGSVNAAVVAYNADASFRVLAPGTQQMRRAILETFRASYGDRRIGLLQRTHIVNLLGSKKPFAAKNWLKTLRGLMAFLVASGRRADDPTLGVKVAKARAGELHSWTEAEIAAFEARHVIGTRPRLAMALLLYTAQRRSDVVRMGRQHVRDGMLMVRQQKTSTALGIPIHPVLAAILNANPSDNLTFVTTANGKPFSPAGFGNLFRQWCDDAGLPKHCTPHGLRKAACRRLAEAGCSEHQIAAISGHASLSEVARYTRAANQAKMAKAAMATISRAFPGPENRT